MRAFTILSLLLLAACTPGAASTPQPTPVKTAAPGTSAGAIAGAKLSVIATIPPIRSLAEPVAGDLATVRSIVPPGTEAHGFAPKPSDVQAIGESALVLKNGLGLDDWVDKIIANAGGERTVAVVSEGIPLREGGKHEGEAEDEGEGEGGYDPHVWFSVTNAMTMTGNIRDALIEVDPSNAAAYQANANNYLEKLAELDRYIRDQIATIPPDQRKIVTNHEALGYYVEAYGLTFAGSIIPSMSTEAQPSAQDVAGLIERIKAEKVRAIFLESSANPQLAKQIAADAGIKVVDTLYGDSLGPPGTPGETYEGMMRHNTDAIVSALR